MCVTLKFFIQKFQCLKSVAQKFLTGKFQICPMAPAAKKSQGLIQGFHAQGMARGAWVIMGLCPLCLQTTQQVFQW